MHSQPFEDCCNSPSIAVFLDWFSVLITLAVKVTRTTADQHACAILLHLSGGTHTAGLTHATAAANVHVLTGLLTLRATLHPHLTTCTNVNLWKCTRCVISWRRWRWRRSRRRKEVGEVVEQQHEHQKNEMRRRRYKRKNNNSKTKKRRGMRRRKNKRRKTRKTTTTTRENDNNSNLQGRVKTKETTSWSMKNKSQNKDTTNWKRRKNKQRTTKWVSIGTLLSFK